MPKNVKLPKNIIILIIWFQQHELEVAVSLTVHCTTRLRSSIAVVHCVGVFSLLWHVLIL